jgi:uncharacterized membrane protein
MDFERPMIKIIPSRADILLDRISLLTIIALWIFTIVQYFQLPDSIPIHFNIKAEIDNYGNKATIFILPAIISIVFAGLTVLNKFPHIFNYPRSITGDNAVQEYTKATRLIRIIKLVIAVFTLLISFFIAQSAKAGHSTLPVWIVPIFMIAMIAPILMTFFSTAKNKKISKS